MTANNAIYNTGIWFSIDEYVGVIENDFVKNYFNIIIPYGWKYFYIHFNNTLKSNIPNCYICNKQNSILCVSCDMGGCGLPRFTPHTISMCMRCIIKENSPPPAPSCCFKESIMIKSANKY